MKLSKARDLANLGTNTAALATDAEVTAAITPKADKSGTLDQFAYTTSAQLASILSDETGTGSIVLNTNSNLIGVGEKVTILASAVGTGGYNFDLKSQSIVYVNADAVRDIFIAFRGDASTTVDSMMQVGQSITAVFMWKLGATARVANGGIPNTVYVDSNGITPKWLGGTPPTGNANAIDSYSFTIVKTAANTFTVFASVSKFA